MWQELEGSSHHLIGGLEWIRHFVPWRGSNSWSCMTVLICSRIFTYRYPTKSLNVWQELANGAGSLCQILNLLVRPTRRSSEFRKVFFFSINCFYLLFLFLVLVALLIVSGFVVFKLRSYHSHHEYSLKPPGFTLGGFSPLQWAMKPFTTHMSTD